MESRLPDINTEFITYRNDIRIAIKSGNVDAMVGNVNNLNALLPEDYRVKISTEEYEKAMQAKKFFICPDCKAETPQEAIKVKNRLLSPFEEFLATSSSAKVWKCPKCEEENRVEKTQTKLQKLAKPFYLQVIPDPPVKHSGLSSHRFIGKMREWTYRAMAELAYQESRYREEYVPKEGEEEHTMNDNELEALEI